MLTVMPVESSWQFAIGRAEQQERAVQRRLAHWTTGIALESGSGSGSQSRSG